MLHFSGTIDLVWFSLDQNRTASNQRNRNGDCGPNRPIQVVHSIEIIDFLRATVSSAPCRVALLYRFRSVIVSHFASQTSAPRKSVIVRVKHLFSCKRVPMGVVFDQFSKRLHSERHISKWEHEAPFFTSTFLREWKTQSHLIAGYGVVWLCDLTDDGFLGRLTTARNAIASNKRVSVMLHSKRNGPIDGETKSLG